MAMSRQARREWPRPQEATPGVQERVNKVRTQVEENLQVKFDVYEAVLYKSQETVGVAESNTSNSVKVYVGGDRYIHVRILEASDGTVNLTSVTDNRKKDDLI